MRIFRQICELNEVATIVLFVAGSHVGIGRGIFSLAQQTKGRGQCVAFILLLWWNHGITVFVHFDLRIKVAVDRHPCVIDLRVFGLIVEQKIDGQSQLFNFSDKPNLRRGELMDTMNNDSLKRCTFRCLDRFFQPAKVLFINRPTAFGHLVFILVQFVDCQGINSFFQCFLAGGRGKAEYRFVFRLDLGKNSNESFLFLQRKIRVQRVGGDTQFDEQSDCIQKITLVFV